MRNFLKLLFLGFVVVMSSCRTLFPPTDDQIARYLEKRGLSEMEVTFDTLFLDTAYITIYDTVNNKFSSDFDSSSVSNLDSGEYLSIIDSLGNEISMQRIENGRLRIECLRKSSNVVDTVIFERNLSFKKEVPCFEKEWKNLYYNQKDKVSKLEDKLAVEKSSKKSWRGRFWGLLAIILALVAFIFRKEIKSIVLRLV